MNIAMKLTFDGLIRALRVDAQRFANAAEPSSAESVGPDGMPARRKQGSSRSNIREGLDDRRRD